MLKLVEWYGNSTLSEQKRGCMASRIAYIDHI